MTSQFRPVGGLVEGFDRAADPLNAAGAFRVSQSSHAAYVSPRKGLCIGNDNTCGARQAKGTAYCAGHLRSIAKKQKEDRKVTDAAE